METQEYQGWSNRETWATMLHIDNDEVLLETAMDYTRIALHDEKDSEGLTAYYLGEQLSQWIQDDLLTLENVAGNKGLWLMLTDIGSLYRVNWREIAESLIGYAKEQVSA
jgi:hypothetical protein